MRRIVFIAVILTFFALLKDRRRISISDKDIYNFLMNSPRLISLISQLPLSLPGKRRLRITYYRQRRMAII